MNPLQLDDKAFATARAGAAPAGVVLMRTDARDGLVVLVAVVADTVRVLSSLDDLAALLWSETQHRGGSRTCVLCRVFGRKTQGPA